MKSDSKLLPAQYCVYCTISVMEKTLPDTPDFEAIPVTENEAAHLLETTIGSVIKNNEIKRWYIIRGKTPNHNDFSPFWRVYDENRRK